MTAPAGPVIMGSVAQPLVDRAAAATTPPVQLPPPNPVIVPATDLGGVGVLKHGNLYLLSDPFGDVHPDLRGLGLYDLDTRVLSCAVLRINGVRPTLLRTQSAANHIATIQLTNPELRRDPAIKKGAQAALASRAISVTRRRWIAGGLAERIEVTNYSAFANASSWTWSWTPIPRTSSRFEAGSVNAAERTSRPWSRRNRSPSPMRASMASCGGRSSR